jgi:hypothetical protein
MDIRRSRISDDDALLAAFLELAGLPTSGQAVLYHFLQQAI